MEKALIVIGGPTASGKTNIAVKLAKKFNGEIINADSRTVYREMDLATSKPTLTEKQNIPHHLFDILNPDQPFSVAEYKKLANEKIEEIQGRNHLPILVGGTGLYLDATIYSYNLTTSKPNLELRRELNQLSIKEILDKLKKVDPKSAEKIDPNNKRRLIRALEVTLTSGRPFSKQQKKKALGKNVLYLALDIPRVDLYRKINKRVDSWVNDGLVEETKKLSEKYPSDLPAMSSLGYKEIIEYISGTMTLDMATEIMKRRTRNYAKRQLTWLKRNKDIKWVKSYSEAASLVQDFLSKES
jgi:tRNA dimethylallyltransferase